ncbi:hypothetical protein BCR36DRAFT_371462 [Piromyces finnis]|uniref:Uncharacterized protein n=1 Tax=Piromyces finnis TaxID=1754191 RepID=A0A1Y1V5J1_9FUNG|nr:hypothetical protein BCR36DRAFT_371462 [Piromyces finnis]|eukprot:ORX47821.1 hypothetical protein BCR36DRAFT_371462 [Piromyces finnis]
MVELGNKATLITLFRHYKKFGDWITDDDLCELHFDVISSKLFNVHDKIDIIKILFAYGKDINYIGERGENDGYSALSLIKNIDDDNLLLIKFLLEKGAEYDCGFEGGDSLISRAIRSDNAKALNYLLNYVKLHSQKDKSKTN